MLLHLSDTLTTVLTGVVERLERRKLRLTSITPGPWLGDKYKHTWCGRAGTQFIVKGTLRWSGASQISGSLNFCSTVPVPGFVACQPGRSYVKLLQWTPDKTDHRRAFQYSPSDGLPELKPRCRTSHKNYWITSLIFCTVVKPHSGTAVSSPNHGSRVPEDTFSPRFTSKPQDA